MDITNKQFIVYLRSALHHIYYPDQLRRSPLIGIFGISDRVNVPSALQKILTDAINELRPGVEEAPRSRSWIVYDTLFFLYIRGYERKVVANQLGISDRQFSREQRTSVETLAIHLWEKYSLGRQQPQTYDANAGISAIERMQLPHEWSEILPIDKPASWKQVVISVLDLIQPLAKEYRVTVGSEEFTDLPDLVIPKFGLRHSLLNLLEWVIPLTAEGNLRLFANVQPQGLGLSIQARIQSTVNFCLDETGDLSLIAAHQLLEKSRGKLEVLNEAESLTIILFLPVFEKVPVLLIDDNPDTFQLFQRYTEGTRYSITGIVNSNSLKSYVEKIAPKIILLDIMMPEIDGWEVLIQLRQDLPTDDVAIIICSIMPVESLARSLGANAFLQKPVLPQDFLNTLDQQMQEYPLATD